MELYLGACSKPAHVAVTKTVASVLAADTEQCGDVSGRKPDGVFLWGPQAWVARLPTAPLQEAALLRRPGAVAVTRTVPASTGRRGTPGELVTWEAGGLQEALNPARLCDSSVSLIGVEVDWSKRNEYCLRGNKNSPIGVHKTHFVGVGPAQLLDLPLGVKLPVIPGSNAVFYTTNVGEKVSSTQLFRPSYGFNLTDPYCRLLENQYKSLHDPHLKAYYKRKDILKRLKKGGYVTSNNKVVCTLRELNKYRQYLTNLKLDFERNYIREQKILAKQLHNVPENNQIPQYSDVAQVQNWLLKAGTESVKDQERLMRHR
ncbi:Fibrous sheath-interacting protein 2 [Saguinus oedipus]|uniref:Fibrous sheath-interacting protein 2 n=1 Tax=Saguinus oedipus TaxID=9490 RepID=A0ABQ9VHC4_SAGOE|nr:Fibrous sheath-interacting protein 2 [Saguinus oedipus]